MRVSLGRALLWGAIGTVAGSLAGDARAGALAGAFFGALTDNGTDVQLGAATAPAVKSELAAVRKRSKWVKGQPIRKASDAVLALKFALGQAIREVPAKQAFFASIARRAPMDSGWRTQGPAHVLEWGIRQLGASAPRARAWLNGRLRQVKAAAKGVAGRVAHAASDIVGTAARTVTGAMGPAPTSEPGGEDGAASDLPAPVTGPPRWVVGTLIGAGALLLLGAGALALRR